MIGATECDCQGARLSSTMIEGQVLACDPPRRLVHSYRSLWGPLAADAPTRVTWEVEAMPNMDKLATVTRETGTGKTPVGGGHTVVLRHVADSHPADSHGLIRVHGAR